MLDYSWRGFILLVLWYVLFYANLQCGKLRKLDHSFLWKIRICIHHAKFTMAYVHVEKITLERPKETFLYVMMNITSPLKSQNQMYTLRTLNIEHYFTWKILSNAPSNARTRKNTETFFLGIMRPSLNEQRGSDVLILFRNSVTWFMR